MGSIIRLKSSQYNGYTVSDVLDKLALDSNNSFLKDLPVVVQKNGKLVMTTEYDHILVSSEDEIIIMPLIAGG